MATILSHFYNEEYLLPFWLRHHKKFFEHGVLVDYNSTDNSVKIIKDICPNWQIIQSRNSYFDALLVDQEIIDLEKNINGWRICLNTTEFIIGNFNTLSCCTQLQLIIPGHIMVDDKSQEFTTLSNDNSVDLLKHRTNGILFNDNQYRGCRAFSAFSGYYYTGPGRHYHHPNTENFCILWYGFSPFNDELIKRKLQIQNKISERDRQIGHGWQHIIQKEELIQRFYSYQKNSYDIKHEIQNYYPI